MRLATQVQARTQQRAAENGVGLFLLGGTHGRNLAVDWHRVQVRFQKTAQQLNKKALGRVRPRACFLEAVTEHNVGGGPRAAFFVTVAVYLGIFQSRLASDGKVVGEAILKTQRGR